MADSHSLPDWRDPANYAYTAHLTARGWAWEFLRRNPAFRALAQRSPKPTLERLGARLWLMSISGLAPELLDYGALAFR